MPLTIHVPTPDTPRKRLGAMQAQGRPMGRVHGGWIADLTGLKQTVMLCPFCQSKFNPRAHAYEVWREEWLACATCDACKTYSPHTKVYIHQAYHDTVGEDRPAHRRRGRWVTRTT